MLGTHRWMLRWYIPPFSAWVAVALVMCCSSCVPVADMPKPASDSWDKVTFELAQLNEEGLRGPADGLRSLSYEFCIPSGEQFKEQVSGIDPSVQFMCGSRGRVGCSDNECLCIGDTHRPGWRGRLGGLLELPYVERIDEAFFE